MDLSAASCRREQKSKACARRHKSTKPLIFNHLKVSDYYPILQNVTGGVTADQARQRWGSKSDALRQLPERQVWGRYLSLTVVTPATTPPTRTAPVGGVWAPQTQMMSCSPSV